MRNMFALGIIAGVSIANSSGEETPSKSRLLPELEKYVLIRANEFEQIQDERKAVLKQIATYVKRELDSGEPARLTFICTHNSRRSHMSQIWASVAARHYRIDGVQTYSGGTESTAFNSRAVSALERAGLKIKKLDETKNPRYAVHFDETSDPMVCFSKTYRDPPNPKNDFCAVMTCSQADKSCPLISGCSLRVAVAYDDPKVADDTETESETYDERCAQISREILFLFSQVRN